MANERVSQLLEVFANDLATNDLFLLTDMSQRESKKLQLGQLMDYFEKSGSFSALSASYSDWAGGVDGANVVGTVTSASYSDTSHLSDSASYSLFSKSGSAALYADRATTASYTLAGGGGSTVSASHADRADLADNASVAAYLYYSGVDNGTAVRALTCSYADDLQIWYGGATPSSTGHGLIIREAVNDGVRMFFSGTVDYGKCVFQTFDNGTEPFLWQTWNYTGVPDYVIDRMLLDPITESFGGAKLTVYGEVSASAYTSSKASGVGFVGTASRAESASYADNVGGVSCKAWAFVTWSAAHSSSCSLYKAKNISDIKYLGTTAPDAANSFDWFGLSFVTPMPDLSFMAMGTALGYANNFSGTPVTAVVAHNPAVGTWITTGVTMSLLVTASRKSIFYSGATQATIQVLG